MKRITVTLAALALAAPLAACAPDESPSPTTTLPPSPVAAPNPTTVIMDPDAPDYCDVAVQLPALEEAVAAGDQAVLNAMADTEALVGGDFAALNDAGNLTLAALEALDSTSADARRLTDNDEALEALDAYVAGIDSRYRPLAEVAATATDVNGFLASASPAIDNTGDLPSQARGVLDGYFAETCAITAGSAASE